MPRSVIEFGRANLRCNLLQNQIVWK